MPQFDPTTFASQVFWLLLCFGVLVTAFVFVFIPRIGVIFEARAQKLRQDLDSVQESLRKFEILDAQREARIGEAEEKASQIVNAVLVELEEKRKKQLQFATEEMHQTVSQMEESLERQKESIQATVRQIVEESLKDLIPKILGAPKVKKTPAPKSAPKKSPVKKD
ncbi:MAG: hypothetical protein NTX76_05115 [Alphaproteobacteria bacterium]|nr:hypothetical protein [Alphaproteobacteria bacterium]